VNFIYNRRFKANYFTFFLREKKKSKTKKDSWRLKQPCGQAAGSCQP
jgi:hypothetical protein